MTEKKCSEHINDILSASLDLAANHGWETVTLSSIAQQCDISEAELLSYISSKSNIVLLLLNDIDDKVSQECSGNFSDTDGAKDRLFDIMMARFDLLNENRAGFISIYKSFLKGFIPSPAIIADFINSMSSMFDIADIQSKYGFNLSQCRNLQIKGLSIVYIMVLKQWMVDETDDMAPTMSALDNYLSHCDRLIKRFDLSKLYSY